MKWIEFTLFFMLDLLLLTYAVCYSLGVTPPAPALAKVVYTGMWILIVSGTRITYKEAKNR